MSHWMQINETGGPDVLRWEARDLDPPGPGEARIWHTAVGVNFTDVHRRRGDHHFPTPVPCLNFFQIKDGGFPSQLVL